MNLEAAPTMTEPNISKPKISKFIVSKPRIAIVHDYFIQSGGAERVAEALCAVYPEAAVFATVALPDRLTPELREARVHTSWMQRLPGMLRFYRQAPVFGLALPVIGAVYTFFTLQSAIDVWRGRGGMWKGRAQARVAAR